MGSGRRRDILDGHASPVPLPHTRAGPACLRRLVLPGRTHPVHHHPRGPRSRDGRPLLRRGRRRTARGGRGRAPARCGGRDGRRQRPFGGGRAGGGAGASGRPDGVPAYGVDPGVLRAPVARLRERPHERRGSRPPDPAHRRPPSERLHGLRRQHHPRRGLERRHRLPEPARCSPPGSSRRGRHPERGGRRHPDRRGGEPHPARAPTPAARLHPRDVRHERLEHHPLPDGRPLRHHRRDAQDHRFRQGLRLPARALHDHPRRSHAAATPSAPTG